MAYTINLTNGTIFCTIPDGTINTSSSMTLIGKNYAGYGQFLDDNFIHLLENSSNPTAPPAPLTGQLWWDSQNNLLKVFNGTTFKTISAASSGPTAPVSNVTGDLWFNTSANVLNVYNGSTFIAVGPSVTNGTGTQAATILDNLSVNHNVVEVLVGTNVTGIISKDATFTPATSIPGFTTIAPGYNMANAISGVNQYFQGTATNSLSLGGQPANAFLSAGANITTANTISVVNNGGITVGANQNLTVGTIGNAIGLIQNTALNGNIVFSVNEGGIQTTVMTINGATGTISGTQINANYADVAERFEADEIYEAGTVVELGGSAEITKAKNDLSDAVFGVISTKAAYLMNSAAGDNESHPPVAMTGRVPVRSIGVIHKGDRLVSAGNGLARAATAGEATAFNVIGRALQDKLDPSEGTVEAIVTIK